MEAINIVNKASKSIHLTQNKNFIKIPTQKDIYILSKADIVYLTSESNYTTFYIKEGKPILTSKTLKYYDQILSPRFLRIHQSYLINPLCIRKISSGYDLITLIGEIEVPVSRSRKAILREVIRIMYD